MSKKFVLRSLDPAKIRVPDVRVTSSFDDEILEMFKSSFAEAGIMQPILVARGEDGYVLIDGLHRLEEAKLNNLPAIPAAVIEAGEVDIALQNLTLNRLRGKTKASEMAKVIGELSTKFNLSIEDIAKRTGMRRDYVEKMLCVSKLSLPVLEALDLERIGVGHAYEISRIEDPDVQSRLLSQVLTYRMSIDDLRGVVDETLRILRSRSEKKIEGGDEPVVMVSTAKCNLCEQDWPIRKVMGFNLCISCYALAQDAVKKSLDKLRLEADAEREKARAMAAEAARTG